MRNDEKPQIRNEIEPVGTVAVETPLGTVRIVDETHLLDPMDLRRAGDAMVGHLHINV